MFSIKKLLAISLLIIISIPSYSQYRRKSNSSDFSLSGQGSYIKFFGGSDVSNIGIGIKGDYGLRDDLGISGGFNYYLPYTMEGQTTATAKSSTTSPQYITVDEDTKIPFMNFYVGLKKYFVGGYSEDFGLYGIGEMGLLISNTSSELGDYDEEKYTIETYDAETLSNFMLTLGFGLEGNINFAYLFADVKLNLPANQENGEEVAVEIPASVVVNLGLRFPF